jgi:hypothetical protein
MFHLFTTWSVGVMNGLWHDQSGLPTGYKYGTMAIASGISIMNSVGNLKLPVTHPGPTITGICLIPFVVGSIFCTGNYFGKSAAHLIKDGSAKLMGDYEIKAKPKSK